MCTLSDRDIKAHPGVIKPFILEHLQPASIDVCLGSEVVFISADGIKIPLSTRGPIGMAFPPGMFVLGTTVERLHLPHDMRAKIDGKSSIGRLGITVQNAGYIDPGFEGTVTLEIVNIGNTLRHLKEGMLIAQVSFDTLTSLVERPYGHPELHSHYQHQTGTTNSVLAEELQH